MCFLLKILRMLSSSRPLPFLLSLISSCEQGFMHHHAPCRITEFEVIHHFKKQSKMLNCCSRLELPDLFFYFGHNVSIILKMETGLGFLKKFFEKESRFWIWRSLADRNGQFDHQILKLRESEPSGAF